MNPLEKANPLVGAEGGVQNRERIYIRKSGAEGGVEGGGAFLGGSSKKTHASLKEGNIYNFLFNKFKTIKKYLAFSESLHKALLR